MKLGLKKVKSSIKKFKDPYDLLDWMKCIKYGWMDEKYKIYTDFKGVKFGLKFRLLLPLEVYKHKVGICWDQALFAKYIFDTQFNFDEVQYIFYQLLDFNTHAFVVYKDKGKWYYFENSWEDNRGITGPYKSVEDILEYVHTLQLKEEPKGKEYIWTNVKDNISTKLNMDDFLDLVGYDHSRTEPPQ